MATQIIIVCDFADMKKHAGEVRTREFTVDGFQVQIDLCADHGLIFDGAFAPFMKFGRILAKPPGTLRAETEARNEIRAWARLNGWPDLSRIGKIPDEIVQKYNAREQ